MRGRLLGDLFAACSGLAVLACVGWSAYLFVQRDLLLTLSTERWTAHVVALGIAVVAGLAMWGWMLVDCAVRMARWRQPYLAGWLAVLIVLWPAAWAYYVLQYRRPEAMNGV